MKVRDIAAQYNVSVTELESFIEKERIPHRNALLGMVVEDGVDVSRLMKSFKEEKAAQWEAGAAERERAAAERERAARAEAEKKKAMSRMLITSGFSFDGYTIKKYSGYISGDDVMQVERGTHGFFSSATNTGAALSEGLTAIRRNALAELKEAAYDLGCNAVIGVDFDYITLEPETANSSGGTIYLPYVFCVTANGNAVVIEKDDSGR